MQVERVEGKCALLNAHRKGIYTDGWQDGEKLNLDGEISACIRVRVYVRVYVRAFEVGDPAARWQLSTLCQFP